MAKILVIEDDPHTALLTKVTLSRNGYEVSVAENGLQGLKQVREEPPNLILLDLMLPGMDGFEILNRLRTDPQTADMPVVILSAKSRVADRQMADQLGANGYLIKPYEPKEMLALIESLLSESAIETETPARVTSVAFVGPHSAEATTVALYAALALAEKGESVLLVDLRALSVEHPMRLGIAPSPQPIALSSAETMRQLPDLAIQHPNGLRLLNNLEGRGMVGQLVPEDVGEVLDKVLAREGFVLVDLPIYPNELLKPAGSRCNMVTLVAPSDPTVLMTARHLFLMLDRTGLPAEQMSMVLTKASNGAPPGGLPRPALAAIPDGAEAGAPAFQILADRLIKLAQGESIKEIIK